MGRGMRGVVPLELSGWFVALVGNTNAWLPGIGDMPSTRFCLINRGDASKSLGAGLLFAIVMYCEGKKKCNKMHK